MSDDSADFLRQHGFYCVMLRATLTKKCCADRQQKAPQKKNLYGRGIASAETPQNQYCRSGKCHQGKLVLIELRKR